MIYQYEKIIYFGKYGILTKCRELKHNKQGYLYKKSLIGSNYFINYLNYKKTNDEYTIFILMLLFSSYFFVYFVYFLYSLLLFILILLTFVY